MRWCCVCSGEVLACVIWMLEWMLAEMIGYGGKEVVLDDHLDLWTVPTFLYISEALSDYIEAQAYLTAYRCYDTVSQTTIQYTFMGRSRPKVM